MTIAGRLQLPGDWMTADLYQAYLIIHPRLIARRWLLLRNQSLGDRTTKCGPLFSSSGSLCQHTPTEPLLRSLCIDTSVCNRFLFPRTKHTLSSLGSCVGVKHPCVDLSLPPVGPTFRCGLGWSPSAVLSRSAYRAKMD